MSQQHFIHEVENKISKTTHLSSPSPPKKKRKYAKAFFQQCCNSTFKNKSQWEKLGKNLICIRCTFFSIYLACYSWCPLGKLVVCLCGAGKNVCVHCVFYREKKSHTQRQTHRDLYFFFVYSRCWTVNVKE